MMARAILFAVRQHKRRPLYQRTRKRRSKEESMILAQIVRSTTKRLDSTIWQSNYKAILQPRLTYLDTVVAPAQSDTQIDCCPAPVAISFRKEALMLRGSFSAMADSVKRML